MIRDVPRDVVAELVAHAANPGQRRQTFSSRRRRPGPLMVMEFRELMGIVRSRTLSLGMNPGGPLPSAATYKPNRDVEEVHWTALVDWTAKPASV